MAVQYGAADAQGAEKHRRISYIIGGDGKIVKLYDPVQAAEHPEQVESDFQALGL